MVTRKFIIEYSNDKPLLPNEHLRFVIHPQHHKENIETLRGVLKIITDTLQFTPVKDK